MTGERHAVLRERYANAIAARALALGEPRPPSPAPKHLHERPVIAGAPDEHPVGLDCDDLVVVAILARRQRLEAIADSPLVGARLERHPPELFGHA